MSGRYIPPHKRHQARVEIGFAAPAASSSTKPVPEDDAVQREMWEALRRTLVSIVNKLSAGNLRSVCEEIFRENIIRGRGLLCRALIHAQQADPQLTPVFASFVAVCNKEVPAIGELLCRRLVLLWHRLQRRRAWQSLIHVDRFLAQLYLFGVVDEEIVMELLAKHLSGSKRAEEDIDAAAAIFSDTFREISQRNPKEFHTTFLEPFRESLAVEDPTFRLSTRSQTIIEGCLKEVQAWQKVRHEVHSIPAELRILPEGTAHQCHSVELDESYDGQEELDQYQYDDQYEAHEDAYDVLRRSILGDDWEEKLLQAALAEQEALEEQMATGDQEMMDDETGTATGPPALPNGMDAVLTTEEERRIKSNVYLAIRSSLRADEVTHKILKALVPGTEATVSQMILDACCEESAFKKLYAMIAERLCKLSSKFQRLFTDALQKTYQTGDSLPEKNLMYLSKVWAHLLRTDAIFWTSLSVMDILHNDVSQRVMMQELFLGLSTSMGSTLLQKRLFQDAETVSKLRKLFPTHADNLHDLQHAIDLFEAMKVGELAMDLRVKYEDVKMKRKRERE